MPGYTSCSGIPSRRLWGGDSRTNACGGLRHNTATIPHLDRPASGGPSRGSPSLLYFTEHTETATVHAFRPAARQAARLRSSASFLVLPRPGLTSFCFVSVMAPHWFTKFTTMRRVGRGAQ